ncbi:translocation/assembly module TamB domain-containing protein [candidate division CSSED10-310 bacterium]|uniref:Translocation/assembly module TamB domain-containing protein n=1 Tax=candidate division CSSED10-310 bacterium TaxID=2855610 RepID=A0ABV6YY79_UNCC1
MKNKVSPVKKKKKIRLQKIIKITLYSVLILVFILGSLTFVALKKMRVIAMDVLSSQFGREVRIGSLSVDYFGNFALTEVSIANPEWCQEPYWIKADRVEGQLDLAKLQARCFDFRYLVIKKPSFYLEVLEGGKNNLPDFTAGDEEQNATKPGPSVHDIFLLLQGQHVALDNGVFTLRMPAEELYLKVPSVSVLGNRIAVENRVAGDSPTYNASLKITNAHFKLKDILDIRASLAGEQLEVDSDGVRITDKPFIITAAEGTKFESVRGYLKNFGYPFLNFDVTSAVAVSDVKKSLFIPIVMVGDAHLNGHLEGLADDLTVTASLKIPKISQAWNIMINRLSSQVRYEDGKVSFTDFQVFLSEGRMTGSGELQFLDDINFKMDTSFSHLSLASLTNVFGLRQPLNGFLAGTLSLTGDDFILEKIQASGGFDCEIESKRNKQTDPTQMAVEQDAIALTFFWAEGDLSVEKCHGSVRGTSFSLQGMLKDQETIEGEYLIESQNLRNLYNLVSKFSTTSNDLIQDKGVYYSLTSAPKSKRSPSGKIRSPISGQGRLKGSILGPLTKPTIEADLLLTECKILQNYFQNIKSTFSLNRDLLVVKELQSTGDRMTMNMEADLALTELAGLQELSRQQVDYSDLTSVVSLLPRFRIKADIKALDLRMVTRFSQQNDFITGEVDAHLDFRHEAELLGSGQFVFHNINVFGEKIFQTVVDCAVRNDIFFLDKLKILLFDQDIGLSEINGTGRLALDGTYDFNLATENLKSSFIAALSAYDVPLAGIVSANITGQGHLTSPSIAGRASFYDINLYGNKLGMGQATVIFEKNKADVKANLLEKNISLEATLDLGRHEIDSGTITLHETDYLPFLALIGLQNSADLVGIASGKVILQGSYLSADQLLLNASFQQVIFGLQNYKLTNVDTVQVRLEDGVVYFQPFNLSGQKSSLYVSGNLDLVKNLFKLGCEGKIDLELLPLIEPEIKFAAGNCIVGANLEGPFSSPYFFLETQIINGTLTPAAIPLEFSNIVATFLLNNRNVEIAQCQAELGKGTINVSGNFLLPSIYEEFDPLETEVDFFVEAWNCDVDYPDGFEGVISAQVNFTKSLLAPFISGSATIQSGTYEAEINIRAILLETLREVLVSRPVEVTPPEQVGFNPTFSVDIKHLNPVKLISEDLLASFLVDLHLYGDLENLNLRGNLDIDEGEVLFDDRIISITSGTISFLNPKGIYPTFDILGESIIEDFHLNIAVTGEYPDVIVSFNSDENLSKTEILTLVLTGQVALQTVQAQSELTFFASDILLNNLLNNEIVNKVKQLFIIDKFQVTPVSGTDPGTGIEVQITVGAEVMGGYLTYTRTPESTDYDIITAEWELSRRLVIEFLRDEENNYGGDIRFKFPFP